LLTNLGGIATTDGNDMPSGALFTVPVIVLACSKCGKMHFFNKAAVLNAHNKNEQA
jgi:hypothetical protein